MPLPNPDKGEKSKAFISRCMANDTMGSEFPEQDVRAAVCYRRLRKARGKRTLKPGAKKG